MYSLSAMCECRLLWLASLSLFTAFERCSQADVADQQQQQMPGS